MSNLFEQGIMAQVDSICSMIDTLPIGDKVKILNEVRSRFHAVSPFKDEPVDLVLWVSNDEVKGNDYNPNTVAPPEMRLLQQSISEDGYTQPIVAHELEAGYEVVDGFHRHKVGKSCKKVRERIHGYLPLTKIRDDASDPKHRIASTIRHNRARGVHGVMPMTDIVRSLVEKGWSDHDISFELGMDADELLRFKQNSGLPELFKNHEFSSSWT
jgi:ParB-like chromosome segregation protein Spo0J